MVDIKVPCHLPIFCHKSWLGRPNDRNDQHRRIAERQEHQVPGRLQQEGGIGEALTLTLVKH